MLEKIAYVEHPVTTTEKKALNASGFRVLDVRFKPEEIAKGDKVVMKPKATETK